VRSEFCISLVKSEIYILQDLDNSGTDETILDALKKSVSSPGVAVITKVKCVKTGKQLTIGNVHIMWEWFRRMDIQCVQVRFDC